MTERDLIFTCKSPFFWSTPKPVRNELTDDCVTRPAFQHQERRPSFPLQLEKALQTSEGPNHHRAADDVLIRPVPLDEGASRSQHVVRGGQPI